MFRNYEHRLKSLARENRKAGNLAEVLLWNCLRKKQLEYVFNRQKPIGNYVVDFLCKDLMLVIEVDGCSHEDRQDYDLARESCLIALGYSVLRFRDDNVLKNIEAVIARIQAWIDGER